LTFASIELAKSNGVSFHSASPEGPSPAIEIAFVTDDVPAAISKAVQAGTVLVCEPKQKPLGQTLG
jgi:lactoylglutathione lyase